KQFKGRFEIQRSRSTGPDRRPDKDSWVFDYQLRPRREGVTAIPYLRVSYYNPDIVWPEKRWQVTYSNTVPIKIPPPVPTTQPRPVQAPPEMLQIEEGPSLLRRESPSSFPATWLIALLAVTPPLACLGWYLLWTRLYPDAAR